MSRDIDRLMVDLYAGDELTEELTEELESRAMSDPELSHDMYTLRKVCELLQENDGPQLTEESSQRILMRMRTKGALIEQNSPDPAHLQYHLPIQG